jgi:hypothetical protein
MTTCDGHSTTCPAHPHHCQLCDLNQSRRPPIAPHIRRPALVTADFGEAENKELRARVAELDEELKRERELIIRLIQIQISTGPILVDLEALPEVIRKKLAGDEHLEAKGQEQ